MNSAHDSSGADPADKAGSAHRVGEPTLGDLLSEALKANAPLPPILAAGRGDTEALRHMARSTYGMATEAVGVMRLILLTEALTFARLAAATGDRDDLKAVIFLYGESGAASRDLGDMGAGDDRDALGVVLAECAADEGDEEIGELLIRSAPNVTEGAFREARRLQRVLAQ